MSSKLPTIPGSLQYQPTEPTHSGGAGSFSFTELFHDINDPFTDEFSTSENMYHPSTDIHVSSEHPAQRDYFPSSAPPRVRRVQERIYRYEISWWLVVSRSSPSRDKGPKAIMDPATDLMQVIQHVYETLASGRECGPNERHFWKTTQRMMPSLRMDKEVVDAWMKPSLHFGSVSPLAPLFR